MLITNSLNIESYLHKLSLLVLKGKLFRTSVFFYLIIPPKARHGATCTQGVTESWFETKEE